MKSKLYLWLCLLLASSVVRAQQPKPDSLLVLGQHYQLHSNILGEDRPYWIYLPEPAKKLSDLQQSYPVIYLLDGEMNFKTLIGVQSFFNRGRSRMPKAIIVGIENTDRTRDLTPTPGISTKGQATLENSGGGERFVSFLAQELIPAIDQQFPTNKRRILIGHSFGGLTAVNILLKHTALFSDYLVMDPSMWWDHDKLLNEAKALLEKGDFSQARLFLCRSDEPSTDDTTVSKERATTLPELLKTVKPAGLRWKYQDFKGETHGSMILPALFYGLRYLYESP